MRKGKQSVKINRQKVLLEKTPLVQKNLDSSEAHRKKYKKNIPILDRSEIIPN